MGLGRPQHGVNRSIERTPKAATLGLGGSAWVDNSEFHIPRTNQMLACPEAAHSRSSSCGPRAGRGGSSMVRLPPIRRRSPSEQQEVVRNLHESILEAEAVVHADASPYASLVDVGLEQGWGGSPLAGNSRGTAPRGPGFNAQFPSCRLEQASAQVNAAASCHNNKSMGSPRRR